MKSQLIKIFLFLFSRPIFFSFWYTISKICLIAMNRSSASLFFPESTGEELAFKFILRNLNNSKKLIFFDCGGNLGHYSTIIIDECNAIKVKFDLFIFEPSTFCYTSLQKRFENLENIKLYKLAISNLNGVSNLYYPWEGFSGASLCEIVSEDISSFESKCEEINTITLDVFCSQNNIFEIDFLKIDIEGFEFLALQGASKMLTNNKVKFIQIEIGSASLATKCTLFDIWQMLNKLYRFYLILNQGIFEIKEYKTDLECFYGASNFLLELHDTPQVEHG